MMNNAAPLRLFNYRNDEQQHSIKTSVSDNFQTIKTKWQIHESFLTMTATELKI